jgi:competence protein ComEC
VGIICLGLAWPMRNYQADELRMDFISVGHGGCTILELPDGRVVLYDVGSLAGPEVVARHIAPYLWHRGIHKIDEVFISHADLDHFNALAALSARFAIGQVTTTPSFEEKTSPGVKETLRQLQKRGIAHKTIHAPARWQSAGVDFEVLHPPIEGPAGIENVRSLVLAISHAGHRFLLTGDIEKTGLDMVLAQNPQADVLMAPHHGSATANPVRLMESVKPKIVVVNNADNPFATKPVLPTQVPVWWTGQKGLITFRSHATGLTAEAYKTGELIVVRRGNNGGPGKAKR